MLSPAKRLFADFKLTLKNTKTSSVLKAEEFNTENRFIILQAAAVQILCETNFKKLYIRHCAWKIDDFKKSVNQLLVKNLVSL